MLLAINGPVKGVYRATKAECFQAERYLTGIKHKQFKESKAKDAFAWAHANPRTGVQPLSEYLRMARLRNPNTPVPKAPREIELPQSINIGDYDNSRQYLLHYMLEGGDRYPCGTFKGQVLKMEHGRVMFKRLFVEFTGGDGIGVYGAEDHVWIYDNGSFAQHGVHVGSCVEFSALAYAYKRKDGSIDFSLKEPEYIHIIEEYALPSKEELFAQALRSVYCEVCIFNEHCDGMCCLMGL